MKQIETKKITNFDGVWAEQVWDIKLAWAYLKTLGFNGSKKTAERRLQSLAFLPDELSIEHLKNEQGQNPNRLLINWTLIQAKSRRDRILFLQLGYLPNDKHCLHANDSRGARFWLPINSLSTATLIDGISKLQRHIGKPVSIFLHGPLTGYLKDFPSIPNITHYPYNYPTHFNSLPETALQRSHPPELKKHISPHLKRLEAESIFILREAVAEAQNPAMLYSVGKDSGVMLHLARKAFFPSLPPFPLLHVDTRWKFQEMYLFRDLMARETGMELLVHINPEAIEKNINPFDHGSALQSRSKERIFSFRSASHQWDPKNQRPEVWNLFNTRKRQGESIRVFPLSNWTELDIWNYIYQENIPVVPLYFAKPRPVIVRPEMIMMVDDDRCQMLPHEKIEVRKVRFRTLGCYPLTGAIESNAETVEDILIELINTHQSERQGRQIDKDGAGSMEKKKQEGYF
jgi:sulfate adenylyltransferase subunit 2